MERCPASPLFRIQLGVAPFLTNFLFSTLISEEERNLTRFYIIARDSDEFCVRLEGSLRDKLYNFKRQQTTPLGLGTYRTTTLSNSLRTFKIRRRSCMISRKYIISTVFSSSWICLTVNSYKRSQRWWIATYVVRLKSGRYKNSPPHSEPRAYDTGLKSNRQLPSVPTSLNIPSQIRMMEDTMTNVRRSFKAEQRVINQEPSRWAEHMSPVPYITS